MADTGTIALEEPPVVDERGAPVPRHLGARRGAAPALEPRLTVAVFGLMMALTIALAYVLERIGFGGETGVVIRTLGLSFFFLTLPATVQAWRARRLGASPTFGVDALVLLIALATTTAVTAMTHTAVMACVMVLAVAGLAMSGVVVLLWLREVRGVARALIPVGGAAYGLWVGGVVWPEMLWSPNFFESLAADWVPHVDSLYHVAVANMIRTYGTPSTGVDGVPFLAYHAGSHWLIGRWADLLGVDVLTAYTLAYPVIAVPLLVSALFVFALAVRAVTRHDDRQWQLHRDWRLWAVFVAATVGFIPGRLLGDAASPYEPAIQTASYLFALLVGLLVAALVIDWWRRIERTPRGRVHPYELLAVPILPALVAGLGALKISTLALAMAALVYLVARTRLYRRPVVLVAMVAGLLASVATLVATTRGSVAVGGLQPFGYILRDVPVQWWVLYYPIHYFWTILYVVLRIRAEGIATLGDLRERLAERRLIDVETLVVVAGVCVGISLVAKFVNMWVGYWFSDVQRWVALGLLLASVGSVMRFSIVREGAEARSWSQVQLRSVYRVAVAGMLALLIAQNAVRVMLRAVDSTIGQRLDLVAGSRAVRLRSERLQPTITPGHIVETIRTAAMYRGRLFSAPVLVPALHSLPSYRLVAALRELGRTDVRERRRTLLFIPQSDTLYWRLNASDPEFCWATPLLAPALSGIALVDGMPPLGCDVPPTFGFASSSYRRRTAPQVPEETTPSALCAKTRARGFSRVIVLHTDAAGAIQHQALECESQPTG